MMEPIRYKFLGNVFIRGIIRCENPVHIGGSYQEYTIGGMDNPIIREPNSEHPYIPGSSLRGKMRSMLEWAEGKVELNDKGEAPHHICSGLEDTEEPNLCPICLVFGSPASEDLAGKRLVGPTRLIIRDAYLTECWQDKLEDLRRMRGIPYAEQKMENAIDRITAMANPRPMERTIKGTEFDFEMVYQIFSIPEAVWLKQIYDGLETLSQQESGPKKFSEDLLAESTYDGGRESIQHLSHVFAAMELVEDTYLGGGGSRGSGKVEFLLYSTPEVRTRDDYLPKTEETEPDGDASGDQANSTSTDGTIAEDVCPSPPVEPSEPADSGDQGSSDPVNEIPDEDVCPKPLSELDIDEYIKHVLVEFGLEQENRSTGNGNPSSETHPQNGVPE